MRFLVILLLVFIYTGASAQKTFTYSDKTFIFKILIIKSKDNRPDNDECTASTISIYRKSDMKLMQTISPPENYFPCFMSLDEIFFLEDINFDGLTDFRLMTHLPAAPNVPFYYWIYDPKKQQFQQDTTLEVITSPDIDHKHKIITSSWRGGWGDYGCSTYKYIKGKITLIKEYESVKDDNNHHETIKETTKKLVNGIMKLVESKTEVIIDEKY